MIRISRLIHTANQLWQGTNKSLLGKLRKKTGYTFSNCKKALELHGNDLGKAELWLKEQAQTHGWQQAAKLEGRSTKQGLIAIMIKENHGVLVEINCETDFVARNKKFHDLAETVVSTLLNNVSPIPTDDVINKTLHNADSLKELAAEDGKSLNDHTALTIGNVGENIIIRRALCMTVSPKVMLFGCTHPAPVNPIPVSFGKYGALVALKCKQNNKTLGTQLCQHIIGMNPQRIGDLSSDMPNEDVNNEVSMIYQEFLLDPSISVQQLLQSKAAEVLDFARFEMGEPLETEQNLDCVETCG